MSELTEREKTMSKSTSTTTAITRNSIYLRLLLIVAAVVFGTTVGKAQDQPCNRALSGSVIDVSGYFTAAGRFQHAIVSNDGTLYEIFFDPTKGIFQGRLGRFPDTVAIATEYATHDLHRQSVIIVRQNGEVHHLWFLPSGINSRLLKIYPRIVDVAAFYSSDIAIQRALVATSSGDIIEIRWRSSGELAPGRIVSERVLTNIPGVTHIAGFQTKDDLFNIVIASTRSGEVYEIFYKDQERIEKNVIANYTDIIDVSGFYTDDDQFRHAIVATASGVIHDFSYHPRKGRFDTPLTTVPGLKNISGYATTEVDVWRHVILSTNTGEVQELFYSRIGKGLALLGRYSFEAPCANSSADLANKKP